MNVREIALRSLLAICKDEGYSNIVVSQAIQNIKWKTGTAGFIRN